MRNPFEFTSHYNLEPIKSVLQVGASTGQELPMFYQNGVEQGIFIEPLPEPFQILASQCAQIKNYIPLNCLAGAQNAEEVTLHVASNFGQSSSIFAPTRHLEVYPGVKFEQAIKIPSYTLDTINAFVHQKYPHINQEIDLLYIDVQGAELEVFKGAANTLAKTRIIYTEVTHGTDYDGAVNHIILTQFLECFGFRLCELELDPNMIGHGNAIYIKHKK